MSRSAEKCRRGILWDLITYIQLQNIKKTRRETLSRHLKISEKIAQCRKKSERRVLYSRTEV